MTRKDYALIAEALSGCRIVPGDDDAEYAEAAGHRGACWAVAAALAKDNPRFDRARFLAACGVESGP